MLLFKVCLYQNAHTFLYLHLLYLRFQRKNAISAEAAASRNLSEMQILRPHPRATESVSQEVGPDDSDVRES